MWVDQYLIVQVKSNGEVPHRRVRSAEFLAHLFLFSNFFQTQENTREGKGEATRRPFAFRHDVQT